MLLLATAFDMFTESVGEINITIATSPNISLRCCCSAHLIQCGDWYNRVILGRRVFSYSSR